MITDALFQLAMWNIEYGQVIHLSAYEYLVPVLLNCKMKWQTTYDAALEQCDSFMGKFPMLYK
jgi:hypothetical protein